jgi:hypothetical protein
VGSSAAESGGAIQLTAGCVGAIQPAAGSRREETEESSGVYLVDKRVDVKASGIFPFLIFLKMNPSRVNTHNTTYGAGYGLMPKGVP